MAAEWKFYFPDDGQTVENAVPIVTGHIMDAEHAAEEACDYDLSSREGHLRLDSPFNIAVISPEGGETVFVGQHEATIVSHVREAD